MPLTYSSFLPENDTDAGTYITSLVKQSKNQFGFVINSPSTMFVSFFYLKNVKMSPSGVMFCEEQEQCPRRWILKISDKANLVHVVLIEQEETSPGKLEEKSRKQWFMKLDYVKMEVRFLGDVPRYFGPYEIFGTKDLLSLLRDSDLSVDYEPVPYEPGH
jgi:hypothetical protein